MAICSHNLPTYKCQPCHREYSREYMRATRAKLPRKPTVAWSTLPNDERWQERDRLEKLLIELTDEVRDVRARIRTTPICIHGSRNCKCYAKHRATYRTGNTYRGTFTDQVLEKLKAFPSGVTIPYLALVTEQPVKRVKAIIYHAHSVSGTVESIGRVVGSKLCIYKTKEKRVVSAKKQ